MKTNLHILLLQARQVGDPMLDHELECFAARCELAPEAFEPFNMAAQAPTPELLDDVDAVMVGGAGEYSVVTGGFSWHEPMLELMRTIARRRMPMFSSCFGFQALVQAFGGRVETRPDMAEIGTHTVSLTAQGARDPVFGRHPESFAAQFGHNDSVVELPEEFVWLARSERCDYQAIRLGEAPILATQFHPELCAQDNIERYISYLQNYEAGALTADQASEKARQMHHESPHASRLLAEFVARLTD